VFSRLAPTDRRRAQKIGSIRDQRHHSKTSSFTAAKPKRLLPRSQLPSAGFRWAKRESVAASKWDHNPFEISPARGRYRLFRL